MNAMKTPRRQPFGIGTRTEIRRDEQHLLTPSVRTIAPARNAVVCGIRPALGPVRALAGSA